MSEPQVAKPRSFTVGVLAEVGTAKDLVHLAGESRKRGYTKLDAFSPFPIHGIDDALAIRPTRLPWLVLAVGLAAGVMAIGAQWWMNAVDYPYLISGKPKFSLPANVPVTFEVIILAAAFAAFGGMLAFNGLPRLSNPLFRNRRFLRVTNDGFFLLIEAIDPKFDLETTTAFLDEQGATRCETIEDVDTNAELPRGTLLAATVMLALAVLPPAIIASARGSKSEKPRLHNFFDMDFQPKLKSQTTTSFFADRRAMRPRVSGTISRGEGNRDSRFLTGIQPDQDRQPIATDTQSVASMSAVPDDAELSEPNWVEEIPLPVTDTLVERGRERFNIHCAICHGRAGYGNGLASQRALELQQGTWLPPTSLHAEHVLQQPPGKLFNTITHGIRKMPAYGHQIPPADRWAIVLYIEALQKSQNASIDNVPLDLRPALREMN